MAAFSYFKGKVSFQILEQAIRLAFNIYVFFYVSKYFDYEYIASFNFGLTLSALFGALNTFGLTNTIVVELDSLNKNRLLSSSILISFLGTLIALLITIPICLLYSSLNFAIVILTVISFSFRFNDINKAFLLALDHHKLNGIIEIIILIIFTPIKILFLINYGIIPFLIIYIFENIISFVTHIIVYRKINLRFQIPVKKEIFKILNNALPFFLSSIIIGLYSKFDQLFLAYFIDNEELSKYYMGIKINNTILIFISVMVASYYPLMFKMMKDSKETFHKKIKNIIKYSYVISILFVVFNYLFVEDILSYFFDKKFENTGWIATFHSIILIFTFFGALSDKYSAIVNDKKFIYDKYLMTLIISVLLNILLVPIYGIMGSLISLIISSLYQGLFSDYFSRKRRDLFYSKIIQ